MFFTDLNKNKQGKMEQKQMELYLEPAKETVVFVFFL